MRLCRFNDNRLGVVVEDHVIDVTDILDTLPQYRYPLPRFDPLMAQLDELTPQIHAKPRNAKALPLSNIQILSPVASPGKIIAAPVNYQKHLMEARADLGINHASQIAEIQKVGLFLKATSSLIGPSHGVVIRHSERRNDHEIELAVVIGKNADRASEAKAMDLVAGYCIGLDMTMRGSEERSLRKSLDTFTVLGPWMVTADEFAEHLPAQLTLRVNGEVRQSASTADLIMGIPELIAYASRFYTLFPGDVLLTGTPEGVGPVYAGDVMTASIGHIGSMTVEVRADGSGNH
jgi:2,4-didehydro-3-deoxy-L-rhamnonate hydrolase